MNERQKMLKEIEAEAQALADKVRAIDDPGGGYGPEMKALIYAAGRSQETVFFLRDAAAAAGGNPAPEPRHAGPVSATPLRYA